MSSDTAINRDALVAEAEKVNAAKHADWGQVVANGGPPCFHLDGNRFCLRAERWAGHSAGSYEGDHAFVSLASLLHADAAKVQPICATGEEALEMADGLVSGVHRRPDDVAFSPHNLVTLALRDSCRRGGVAYVLNGVLSALKRIEVLEAKVEQLTRCTVEWDEQQRNLCRFEFQRAEQAEAEVTRLTADCARISSEFGLPPTMAPADGWIAEQVAEWKQCHKDRDRLVAQWEALKAWHLAFLSDSGWHEVTVKKMEKLEAQR